MQYKFPYRKDRPALTARLCVPGNRARYFDFLIDSGADITLIPSSDAMILGLKYSAIEGEEIEVEVANMTILHTKRVGLDITIEDDTFRIPVLVAKEEVERLLGRKGVFDKFDITFREKDKEVVFNKR